MVWYDDKLQKLSITALKFSFFCSHFVQYLFYFIEIIRITSTKNIKYNVDNNPKTEILSISIDCGDCQTPEENVAQPSTSEATAQPVEDAFSLPQTACKGRIYILTAYHLNTRVKYFLYVLGMDRTKQHNKEELVFLESPQLQQVKIFHLRQEKLIILNVTKKLLYVCDDREKHLKTINVTEQLRNANDFCKFPIFTISHNGEIVCSEGRSKLNVYQINEESSRLEKTTAIALKHVVQSIAFNHQSDELIILCHTVLHEYHLVIYSKNGELKQNIKLQNGDYREAKLIFQRNGRVALLDNYSVLHLK